jgi:hypothetical protein
MTFSLTDRAPSDADSGEVVIAPGYSTRILRGMRYGCQLPDATVRPLHEHSMGDPVLNEPILRQKFLERLSELLNREFTTAKWFPVLDQLEQDIGPAAAVDRMRWPSQGGNLHTAIAGVKSLIEQRRAFLLREIATFRSPAH